jgi:hypothetical protein
VDNGAPRYVLWAKDWLLCSLVVGPRDLRIALFAFRLCGRVKPKACAVKHTNIQTHKQQTYKHTNLRNLTDRITDVVRSLLAVMRRSAVTERS